MVLGNILAAMVTDYRRDFYIFELPCASLNIWMKLYEFVIAYWVALSFVLFVEIQNESFTIDSVLQQDET